MAISQNKRKAGITLNYAIYPKDGKMIERNYAVFSADGEIIEYFDSLQEILDKYGKVGVRTWDHANHKVKLINPKNNKYYYWFIPGSPKDFEMTEDMAVKRFHVKRDATAVWVVYWENLIGQGVRVFKDKDTAWAKIALMMQDPSIYHESINISFQNIS